MAGILQYGSTFTQETPSFRIDKTSNGDIVIADYSTAGGSIFKLHDGVVSTLATGFSGYSAVTVLSDDAILLYRQDLQDFGGASFYIVNADGTLRTERIDAGLDGQSNGVNADVRGPSAAATANGGFFLGVTDSSHHDEQVHLSYPEDSDHFTGTDLSRGFDVSHRFYGANGTSSSAYVVDSVGPYSARGAETDYSAGNQTVADTLALTGGSFVEASVEPRYFADTGYRYYQNTVIAIRLVTAGGAVSQPIQVNTDAPTSSAAGSGVEGAGGVQLVSLGDRGFAVIWSETSTINGTDFNGYDTKIRYFDTAGGALTDEIQIAHRSADQRQAPLFVGVDALSDGSIAFVYESTVDSGGRSATLSLGLIDPLGSGLSVSNIAAQASSDYQDFDLKTINGTDVAVSYTDASGAHVSTYHLRALTGTTGADTLKGTGYNDTIDGLDGDDKLFGRNGDDTVIGHGGNDTLNGEIGRDTMIGGEGNDTYVVDNTGDKIVEKAGEGSDTVTTAVSYTLAAGQSVETLRTLSDAGTQAINLTGNELVNKLVGNNGANVLNGGAGADLLYGKDGDDTFVISEAGDKVYETAGQGNDTVQATVSYVLAAGQSIETLRTTSDAGTASINLTGNELTNKLVGNAGANVLAGGGASDSLYGRGGADTFVFKALADSTVAASGRDTIQDFTIGQGDRIDFHLIDAVAGGVVNQAFKFIGANDFHHKAGELRASTQDGNTLISGDVNGDGTADFSVLLKGALTLHSGDFIL